MISSCSHFEKAHADKKIWVYNTDQNAFKRSFLSLLKAAGYNN